MLTTGDSVTISSNPTVRISRFDSFKPFASVSRVLGENPDADLADMRVALRRLLYLALLTEIEFWNDATAVLQGETTTEGLAEHCMKEIGNELALRIEKNRTKRTAKSTAPDSAPVKGNPGPRRLTSKSTVPG